MLGVQAPFLGQLVQTPSIPGGWWTGMAVLLALYCIYEQISFAASRSVTALSDLPCHKSMHGSNVIAKSTGIEQATNLFAVPNTLSP